MGTVERLRRDIDRGRTGGKVANDSAAVPPGAGVKAADRSPLPERVRLAHDAAVKADWVERHGAALFAASVATIALTGFGLWLAWVLASR
jgi:hypothetical protein